MVPILRDSFRRQTVLMEFFVDTVRQYRIGRHDRCREKCYFPGRPYGILVFAGSGNGYW